MNINIPIIDTLADYLLSVPTTWKKAFIRIASTTTFVLFFIFSYHHQVIVDMLTGKLLDVQYAKQKAAFTIVADEQLMILHQSSTAEYSVVLKFRPRNQNFFVDIIAEKGMVPNEVANKTSNPINKLSPEYINHIQGIHFIDKKSDFLPSFNRYHYVYSCPYFNMDNYYAGSIAMFWEDKPFILEKDLEMLCNNTSRVLGRNN